MPTPQQLQQLADGQHWQEIVAQLAPVHARTPDMDFYYGMALAQLQRWPAAKSALYEGRKLAPRDSRFPIELAGIAFKQHNRPLAERHLRQALRLAPRDAYANEFLATLFFLDGNVEAALKYWNHVGKPQVAEIHTDPQPRVSPALLDHAFAFSPAAPLLLPQYRNTESRLRGLGIFPQFQLNLGARPGGRFDVTFRGRELNGLGGAGWENLFLILRGLPFQSVNPGLWNLRREAINFNSLVRWDAQKRRVFAELSGPWEHGASYRWRLATDLRNENWALRNSFTGPAPLLAGFNMRTGRAGFEMESFRSARVNWRAGAELSHRDFRNLTANSVLTPQMLASGYELQQQAQFTGALWRVPERRFIVTAGAASNAGRLWSAQPQAFESLTGSLAWRWLPRAQGDDYETKQQLRVGRIFGQAPFDQLFMLGLERDNDLPMRAHIGTRDGRKGSAPIGREYFLHNWELDKNLYGNGIFNVRLGPFLDIGKIADPGTQLGSHEWLYDTGVQLKLRVFSEGLVFSYGKDLRTGNNAFYVNVLE